jgi:hypothetical protein
LYIPYPIMGGFWEFDYGDNPTGKLK